MALEYVDMSIPLDSLEPALIRSPLLAWYDCHARQMPWRTGPAALRRGQRPNPYHVWLSEVMLQQTQVATVAGYFNDFLARWPTVDDLAAAPSEDVMAAWAGLGYYSRARNLKKCAEAVVADHDGEFPRTSAELIKLPGIGPYTAAAIAAIAFDEQVGVVDGNIERVIARLRAIEEPVAKAKPEIRRTADLLAEGERPGDLAQAMMDLGATVCTPKKPACMICPLRHGCAGHRSATPEAFPGRPERRDKPTRRGAAYVARRPDGAIFLRRRPDTGMLATMTEVPTTNWSVAGDGATGAEAAPFAGSWRKAGDIRHSFTHFDLELEVWRADLDRADDTGQGWWTYEDSLAGEALPTVMKKAIKAAVPTAFSKAPKSVRTET